MTHQQRHERQLFWPTKSKSELLCELHKTVQPAMQSLAKWSRSAYIQQKSVQPSGILFGQQQRWLASHRGEGRNNRDEGPTLDDIGSTMLNKIK